MADRVVKVTLAANVNSYLAGMKQAQDSTERVQSSSAKVSQKLAEQKQAFELVGSSMVVGGALISAGLALAVSRFADFDQAMSNVKATGEDAAGSIDALRDAALDAGAKTVFSATESANAVEELAKAGVSSADILGGGLTGALSLAAAGGLGVADAAGIAATALQVFGLKGTDMSHVADLLAAGAGKAMGDVTDLSQALAQGGQVAASTGLSIEETTATLSAFASQGLLGSDAGTSFKTMLQRLTPQSEQAKKEMERLGISAYDAQGQFIGMAKFAGNLQTAMKDLTPEQRNASQSIIFGSDAVRASNILYKEGEKGIQDWISAVDDTGYAAKTAATRLDNLKGDVEALGGAFDSALIQTGGTANEMLRGMVQALTGLVDLYNEMPEPVKATVMAVGGATAAIALAGGAALLATPKIAEFKAATDLLGLTMKSTALTAGLAGLALGGLFVVVGELASEHARAKAQANSYAETLEKGTQRITKATREMVKENLAVGDKFWWQQYDSAYTSADKLGISLDLVTDAALGNADALKKLDAQLKSGDVNSFEYAQRAADITNAVKGQSSSIEEAIRIADQKSRVTEQATTKEGAAATAYQASADQVSNLNDQLAELINKLNESNGTGQDAVSSNARYQAALAGISDEVKRQREEYEKANGTLNGFSLSLDQSTVAGSTNAAMLSDVASAAQAAAKATYDQDLTTMSAKDATDKYAATLAAQRTAFENAATAAGFNKDQVKALADQVFQLPSEKEVKILADTAAAKENVANLSRAMYELVQGMNGKTIRLNVLTDSLELGRKYATGGRVLGPGTTTSDSIIARLSNREYIVNAAATDRNLPALDYINQGGTIQGFANGGEVQPRYASSSPSRMSTVPMVQAATFPDSVTLVIGDQEFTAYVKGQAAQVTSAASAPFRGGRR